jgi:hypothetical protein
MLQGILQILLLLLWNLFFQGFSIRDFPVAIRDKLMTQQRQKRTELMPVTVQYNAPNVWEIVYFHAFFEHLELIFYFYHT